MIERLLLYLLKLFNYKVFFTHSPDLLRRVPFGHLRRLFLHSPDLLRFVPLGQRVFFITSLDMHSPNLLRLVPLGQRLRFCGEFLIIGGAGDRRGDGQGGVSSEVESTGENETDFIGICDGGDGQGGVSSSLESKNFIGVLFRRLLRDDMYK